MPTPRPDFTLKPLALLVAALLAQPVLGNPTAPVVVHGSASISQAGNLLTVINSPNAIINWGGFSIGQNEITRFVQQSSASAVLNRVTGADPSQILGQLQSNGRVFLINPNGILFGAGARVDTAGLIASTLRLGDADFLAGRMKFTGDGSEGALSNAGHIATPSGGQVLLIAPDLENSGLITSPGGEVILAAGHTVELADSANPALRVQVTAPAGETLNIGSIVAAGGRIGMYGGLARQEGSLDASSAVAEGGRIFLKAATVVAQGETRADGANVGGRVEVQADKLLQSGSLSANASQGQGGEVKVAAERIIQTESARIVVDGASAGGKVEVAAGQGAGGRLFSSASISAQGAQGGEIKLLGHEVVLLGAHADASGSTGGGSVLVGGDLGGGNPAVPNSANTYVNFSTTLAADATQSGDGGKVVVWSDSQTKFHGQASARGGAQSGDGGFIEISGKNGYVFGGQADAGAAQGAPGTLLLDPQNITIGNDATNYASVSLVDPHIGAGDQFGTNVTELNNGNIVVAEPGDDFGGVNAGAAYLFNGSTGALISTLLGSHDGDQVGSGGITLVGSGNYLVRSPNWAPGAETGSRGAVTWAAAGLGVGGMVSDTNSLVGSESADQIGSGGIQVLDNGHYLVLSPTWRNGGLFNAGAVTWGSAAVGVKGEVSAINSLVGSHVQDFVGNGGVHELPGGDYVVLSPDWNGHRGAVTWGSGTAGVSATVALENSLVGSNVWDAVGGGGIHILEDDNYLVLSPEWNGYRGAVTWGSGTAAISGTVVAANSLLGATADDRVGSAGAFSLPGGRYLVFSPVWDGGKGAITWSDAGAITGNVGPGNSLVGSTAGDEVGNSAGATLVGNDKYLVFSPLWNSSRGAITLADIATGIVGVISDTNSLVGSTANDRIGNGNLVDLDGDYYLLHSPNWNGNRGAVTWFDSSLPLIGTLGASNSLVGATAGDQIGSDGIELLAGGNYLVRSSLWDNGAATDAGAVTWGSRTAGVVGQVGSGNSLVGSHSNDWVGGNSDAIVQLTNGHYLVSTPYWDNGAVINAGAVTWGNGNSGVIGAISAANSLVGSHDNDLVGSLFPYIGSTSYRYSGITPLANGHYLVRSNAWDNGAVIDAGAATWGNGSNGSVVGAVTAANSLVGNGTYDRLGHYVTTLTGNSNYVVSCTTCDVGGVEVGAAAWGSGNGGLVGVIGSGNALVGTHSGDAVGSVTGLTNGNYVVTSSAWNGGLGAVTWGDGDGGLTGAVSAGNSLVGSTPGDQVGSGGVTWLNNGHYVVASPHWDNGAVVDAGAVNWANGTTALIGLVGAGNSLVGTNPGDAVGSGGITQLMSSGDYLVRSLVWNGNRGAVTWGDGASGVVGAVSATNSLVGTNPGDAVGNGGITQLWNTGNYLVLSPDWNGFRGAVTWGSGTSGVAGAVSDGNSLVGAVAGDSVGSFGVNELANGHYVVISPQWDNGATSDAGAVTWGNGTTGISGVVSELNSLVGSSSGDFAGFQGIMDLGNGDYLVASSTWDNAGAYDAGFVAWAPGAAGVRGVISAGNALVGSHAGDHVGATISTLRNGDYLVLASDWNNSAGAVSWGSATAGVRGTVSSLNALVGGSAGDQIGSGGIVELSNGSFLVKSPLYDQVGLGMSNAGRLDIFIPDGALPPTANPLAFGDSPGADATLTPGQITALTNTGTAVVLQANNDIVVDAAIHSNNPSGTGGSLTLQAGHSISVNADISSDDGDLTLIANETVANGVDDGFRNSGAANIHIGADVTVDAGAGAVTMIIRDSQDKIDNRSGTIDLFDGALVKGGSIRLEAVAGTIGNSEAGLTSAVLDSSAHDGPITLIGREVLARLNPGDGLVDVSITYGSYAYYNELYQTTGDLRLSHYQFSSMAGADFSLTAASGDVLIDRDVDLPDMALNLSVDPGLGAVRFVVDPISNRRRILEGSDVVVESGDLLFTSGHVTVDGSLSTYDGLLLSGGQLDLNGPAELHFVQVENAALNLASSSAVDFMDSVELLPGGTLSLPAGFTNLGPDFNLLGGTLVNASHDLDLISSYTWASGLVTGAGSLSLDNGHTLAKTGTGTLTIQQAFNNAGTVEVQDGELWLMAGGTQRNDFMVSAGAKLTLGGTHVALTLGLGGEGTVDLVGTLNIDDGMDAGWAGVDTDTTLNLLAGSSITGAGTLENRGTLDAGALTMDAVLVNSGTANLTGTTLSGFFNTGTLNLAGTVTTRSDSEITDGTVNLISGASLDMDEAGLFWSGGTFAGTGTLGFLNGGYFDFGGSGDRVLDNPNLTFAFTNLRLPDGSLTLRSGGLTFNVAGDGDTRVEAGSTLTLAGGTLTNNGPLVVGGTFNLLGGTYAGAGGVSTVAGGVFYRPSDSTVVWNNTGSLYNAGTLTLSNTTFAGAITNASGGVMNLGAGMTFSQVFTNQGGLNLTAGTTVFQNGLNQIDGSTTLDGGHLQGNVTLAGGSLGGSGNIIGNLTVGNGASVAPGFSPGTLAITGNYTMNAGSTLLVELGGATPGTGYDVVNVSGTATLDGTLDVQLWGGYSPAASTTFGVLNAATVTGAFQTTNLPGAAYSSAVNPTLLQVLYTQAVANVLPIPVLQAQVLQDNQLSPVGVGTPTFLSGPALPGGLAGGGPGGGAGPGDGLGGAGSAHLAGTEGDWVALFDQLAAQAALQGWQDESRLVCR